MAGFLINGAGLVWSGLLLRSGGDGGAWLYVTLAVSGGGMAMAFGPLMTRMLSGCRGDRGGRERRDGDT